MRRRIILALVPVYLCLITGVPLAVALYPVLAARSAWARLSLLVIAPAVYTLLFVLIAGGLSRITARAIVPGRFPRDLNHPVYGPRRLYALCWTAVYYCSPIYHAVLAVPPLRRAVFRLFGYRGSMDFTTYPDSWLRDLPLLDIEAGAYLANRATIGTNICLRNGDIIVAPVRVRRGALVGHLAIVGPGTTVGEEAEVGAGAVVGMRARIGRGAKVGVCSRVGHGVVLGAGCEVGPVTSVGNRAVIADGVVLPPGCVVPAFTKVKSQEDVAALRLVRRKSVAAIAAEQLTRRAVEDALLEAAAAEDAAEDAASPAVAPPPGLRVSPPPAPRNTTSR